MGLLKIETDFDRLALRWFKTGRLRPPPAVRAAWDEHGRTDRYVRVSDVRQLCRSLMPGALVRKHLFWRYSLVWQKPPASI